MGAVHLEKSQAGASPTLTVRNTAFIGNRGRSLFSARGPGSFDVAGAIIQGNHLTSGTTINPSTLLWIETQGFGPIPTGLQQRLRFSTVVGTTADGSNSTLFDHDVSALDLTGSILHSPGLLNRNSSSTGTVVHNGCLLAHDAAGFRPPRHRRWSPRPVSRRV